MGWGSVVFPLLIITPSGGFTGLFLYSPGPGRGNLIGSWTSAAGTDPGGNSYPAGINVTAGYLSGVTIAALAETLNPGPFILDASADETITVFTTPGVNNWTAPAGVTSVQVFCLGPGGPGGAGVGPGFGGGGGGGGEFAGDTIAVTPATVYHPTVGIPGSFGIPGTPTTFAGDTVTVTAHAGSAGGAGTAGAPGGGGAGGTGSTNSTHFSGGPGGSAGTGANSGGGGGGSSASETQAGNAGMNGPNSGAGGAGGAATPGFLSPGGAGGAGGVHNTGVGVAGSAPGGAGGGGGDGGAHAGGTGTHGQVVLVYSTMAVSTFATIAATAGTDPVTGTKFAEGITSIDPVFGTSVTLAGANVTVGGAGQLWQLSNGSFSVITAGNGLRVKEGANCKQGVATLAGGTVTVANTVTTATSRIVLTAQDNNSTGALRVSARTAGTSFTITSSNGADSGLVAYEIFEPG